MKILVLSERDDCCGPMAAAFLRDYSSKLEVVSAGRVPARDLEPMMVVAMRECLIDLSGCRPQGLDSVEESGFDVVYECLDVPCPLSLDGCRDLRDRVKNESFLYYQRLIASR